ncbi:MAG: terminase large subunit [Candidatus Moraniibacteriota bacterium]
MKKTTKITTEKLIEYQNDICVFLEEQYFLDSGKPIKLEPIQRKILTEVFNTKNKDGLRKYNDALIGQIKKSGKSSLASGVALYMLFCDEIFDEPNNVYSIAFSQDQASIIWEKTKKAIERNPILLGSVKIYRDKIVVPSTGSVYKVLSAESFSAHGLDPSCVIGDEIWNQKNRDLLDALQFSPTRKQPLRFSVTYAGTSTATPLFELYEKGLNKENPKMYFHWSHIPEVSWISPEFIEERRRELPPAVFQRFWENKWSAGANSFFTREDVMQCRDEFMKPKFQGEEGVQYFYGCDLGLVKDKTASVILHQDKTTGMIYVDSIKTWQGTKTDPVKIADIEEDMLLASQNFPRLKIIVDPWNLKGTIERLKRHCRIEEFTFTGSNVEKLSRNLYYFIHNGLIKFFPHKELEKELLSLNLEQKSYGYRFDHPSSQFSDHAMALSMALMQVASVRKPTAGILISESPTLEEFMEQQKKAEKSEVKVMSGVNRTEHNQNNYPTLSQLEELRSQKLIL